MTNPFEIIEVRLSNIESLLIDIKCGELSPKPQAEPENMDQLITKKEAAKLLSVHVSTIDNLRRDGSLTRYNIGKSARFKRGDIYQLAEKRKAS